MKKLIVLGGLVAAASAANAVVLYNNGTVINQAPNVSLLTAPATSYGYTSSTTAGFALADNFSVSGLGWRVESLSFYAYQTSAVGYTFTDVTWSLISGAVNGGTVVASGVTASTNGGLIAYRTLSTTPTNTQRAVYQIDVNIPDVTLSAGSYWVTWALSGTSASGPFVPPTIATSGNGQQGPLAGGGFAAVADAGSLASVELPFLINGVAVAVPEPATYVMMLVGVLGLAGVARRRAAKA